MSHPARTAWSGVVRTVDIVLQYFPLPVPSIAAMLLLPLGFCGCSQSPDSTPEPTQQVDRINSNRTEASHTTAIRFEDITDQSGLRFTYRNGDEAGFYSIVESLGGGIGLGDFDNDHQMDVVLPGGGLFPAEGKMIGLPSGLFLQRDLCQFVEVTKHAEIGVARWYSHGASVTDFGNDGFCDILVTGYGGLTLYHNNGDGTFQEQVLESKLDDTQWSSSAAWGDFNKDGALDLYVAHYVNWSWSNNPACQGPKPGSKEVCPPRRFEPVPHKLYVSNRDGSFRDGSDEFGLRKDGKGLGVVVGDVDLDGHIDVYVGNDTVPNFLYRNTGKRFEDAGLMSGTALSDRGTPDGSMGVDIGDLTNDGLPDIWVANYESESFALYRNQGNCFFQHISQAVGVTAVGALYVGWGTILFDADRDSDLDIFCSNGHVIRHPVNAPLRQVPLVYENLEGHRFVDVAAQVGDYFRQQHMGRGCAAGDIDNDGDWDVIISAINEPVSVLSNESPPDSHWLSLRLIGTTSPRDAIGAIVRLKREHGREQVQQVRSGGSYASTNDRRVFFGLGKDATLSGVSIRWPSGVTQEVTIQLGDREVTVIEPNAE